MKTLPAFILLSSLVCAQAHAGNVELIFADKKPLFGGTDHLKRYGKCFGAYADGKIYTAAHCLTGFKKAFLTIDDSLSKISEKCRNTGPRDIAVMETDERFSSFRIATLLPEVGEQVRVHARGTMECTVLGYEPRSVGGLALSKQMKTDCTLGQGYSGAGVENAAGELVGVLSNISGYESGSILFNFFEPVVGMSDCK